MKKRNIVMAITAIFFCFFTGCASIGEVRTLQNAVNEQSVKPSQIGEKIDQLAASQPTTEQGYDAYKLRQSASQTTKATGLGQLTMAEVRGTDKEILAAITPQKLTSSQTGQTDQTVEARLTKLESGMLAHTARLASHAALFKKHNRTLSKHEEKFNFTQERLIEARVLKIQDADGWEFGPYESGSAKLTDDMKLFIKEAVNGIKSVVGDLGKKGETIVLVFKSFTDRDGGKAINEQLQKERSKNCQKEFLAALAAVGVKIETRIIPGENSERSVMGDYDRYTLVMMKKESNIPLPAAPTAKPVTPTATTTPAATPDPTVKPSSTPSEVAPSAAPVDPASSATTPEKPEKQVSGKDVDDKNVVASSKMPRLIQ